MRAPSVGEQDASEYVVECGEGFVVVPLEVVDERGLEVCASAERPHELGGFIDRRAQRSDFHKEFDELTEIRQAVVEACHASPGVWTPLVGNTELAFMRVGLPVTRAGLGKLLGID